MKDVGEFKNGQSGIANRYLKVVLSVCLLSICTTGVCQNVTYPGWLKDSLRRKGLDIKYELNAYMKPAFLQEDLNGDGKPDIAVLITEKITHKKGILLILNDSSGYYVFGAGTGFGDGSDDFVWAGKWYVYKKKSAYETRFDKKSGDVLGGKEIKLSHPCISVASLEDGAEVSGGLIYWNGKKYRWIQQGE